MVPPDQPVTSPVAPSYRAAQNAAWEGLFTQLLEFRRLHGHFWVPSDAEHKALYYWSGHQRAHLKAGRLGSERRKRLEAAGFPGQPYSGLEKKDDLIWERHFAELMVFHQQHGHFNVPRKDANYKFLVEWANHQRRKYCSGKLKPARRQRLEAARFPWSLNMRRGPMEMVLAGDVPAGDIAAIDLLTGNDLPPADPWDAKYEDLVRFHRRFGHSYVPHPWPEQPGLGFWVCIQRQERAAGTLPPEHIARLDDIGFYWKGGWEVLGPDWLRKQKEVLGIFYHDPQSVNEHFSYPPEPVTHSDDDLASC